MNFILQAAIKYLESHPEVVEKLIEQLVNLIISELQKSTK